jgi:hypothetical protein
MKAFTVAERGTTSHRPLFALLRGCQEVGFSGKTLRSQKRPSYTLSSHRFYYNLTEITITTSPLTKILDRLIGGINPCGDCV